MTVGYVAPLNGMMSEAELHVLKERMYQGKLNKARRGELLGLPPIGYDPAPLGRVGDRPRRAGPGDGAADLRRVRPRGDLARPAPLPGPPQDPHPRPARVRGEPRGPLEWRRPNRATLQNLLHHPTYAGAYRFGHRPVDPRRKQPGRPNTGKRIRRPEECLVLIRDRLPAYITWDRFQANQDAPRGQPGQVRPAWARRGRGRRCWPGCCGAGGAGGG